jgi:DNA-binding GntR family transcriptional regulator
MTVNRYRATAREITNDPRPWVQLKNLLARQIEQGILEPGDEVAVTHEAQDFGVAPVSARKAFRALVEEGKLISPQGQGKPYQVAMDASPEAGESREPTPEPGRAESE